MALAYFGTPVGWSLTPGLAWTKYVDMFLAPIVMARPHEGHYALAELVEEVEEGMEGGMEGGGEGEVKVITMNVDDLHERAGGAGWKEEGREGGREGRRRRVVHLHGSVGRNLCVKHGLLSGLPLFPRGEEGEAEGGKEGSSISETQAKSASDSEIIQLLDAYKQYKCPSCHRAPRPDITLFGESLPVDQLSLAARAIDILNPATNDVLLVIGTTGGVYPAASLPERALARGVRLIELNMHPSPITGAADVFLEGRATELLPALLERVRERKNKNEREEMQ